MSRRKVNFYKTVSANDNEKDEFTPANGEKWLIYEVWGHGAHNNEVKVDVCFGDDCLFAVHGDAQPYNPEEEITGDGTKKLTLKLTNDSSSTESFGGGYRAVKL